MRSHRGRHRRERAVVLARYLIGRRDMMTINISSGRLLMKSRPAGVACGSFLTRLRLFSASFSTSSAGAGTSVSIFMPLRCFSSPGVATPSDGALRRHPRTLTTLRTQSGVDDAGGERGIVCVARMGVRPLGGAINIDQWERGGRRSKAVSLPGENDCLISSMNEIYA